MKKILFISLLLTLVVVNTGCFSQDASDVYVNNSIGEPSDEVTDDVNSKELTELDEAEKNDSDTDDVDTGAIETSEAPANNEVASEPAQSENIIIEAPLPNSIVTSPFEVIGRARVFEGTVLVRVINQDGKIVIPEQIVTARGADAGEFGNFKIKINYQFYATKEGIIEIFSQSAEDGKEINMVEVPVKFE